MRAGLRPRRRERGFTLIEALVALAVTAAAAGAIGELGFSTYKAARRAEQHLFLTAVARKLMAALPEGRAPGAAHGEVDGAAWRLETAPYPFAAAGSAPFAPEAVRLVVTAPSGARLAIDTIRLVPAAGAR